MYLNIFLIDVFVEMYVRDVVFSIVLVGGQVMFIVIFDVVIFETYREMVCFYVWLRDRQYGLLVFFFQGFILQSLILYKFLNLDLGIVVKIIQWWLYLGTGIWGNGSREGLNC